MYTPSFRVKKSGVPILSKKEITILLGIWAIGSITLVACLVQTIIHDRNQEKREVARAERDKEYHEKRMSDLQ